EGVDTTSKDRRERRRGRSSSISKVLTVARHLIEVTGFLDRPRRGREACALDIDLARLGPLPQGGGGGVDPDRAGGLGLVRPQEVRDRKRAARSGGGTGEGNRRPPVRAGGALRNSGRGSRWVPVWDS